jgi:hypothetical protein
MIFYDNGVSQTNLNIVGGLHAFLLVQMKTITLYIYHTKYAIETYLGLVQSGHINPLITLTRIQ